MKAIWFFSLVSLFSSFGRSQQTYVPDDQFELRLAFMGLDYLPLNNYVPTANIDTVTILEMNLSVVDPTGIEDFAALKYLDASHTGLIELDLSQNTNLISLNVVSCELQSLNVKNGNNSNMILFNTIGNPDLICVQVDDAAYSSSNWTQIDVQTGFSQSCGTFESSQTYVPDDNFEQRLINLGFDSGPLDDYVAKAAIDTITRLDITNKNISDLTGIEDFTSLQKLYCGENHLTGLNLNSNAALTAIICDNNQLQYLKIKNGNNTAINYFIAFDNPYLTCIEVDDPAYSEANWILVDAQSNFTEYCLVSLSNTEVIDFRIYPNPAQENLTVSAEMESTFIIYNLHGAIVKEGDLSRGENEISVIDLIPGVYNFSLKQGNDFLHRKLIIL